MRGMKKEYVKPVVELIGYECMHIIAASSEQLENGGNIPTGKQSNSNSWGNIWNN